jgi:hypothetical protein
MKILITLSLTILLASGCATQNTAHLYTVTVIVNPQSENEEVIELYPVLVGNGKTHGSEYYGFTNVNPKVHIKQEWFQIR